MSCSEESFRIAIATACMTASGTPTFALTEVEVTQEQYENGVHYYFAEADLFEAGYEEPFVHFDSKEAPPFLHSAVKDYLAIDDPALALITAR